MEVRMISRKREPRKVNLKLIDGSMVRGMINLYHEEMLLNRVSDLFTKTRDPFIVVFGANVDGKANQVVVINKQNIIWVCPEE